MRKYLIRLNEATIKVDRPNEKIFVGAFQNDLNISTFIKRTYQLSVSMFNKNKNQE